MLRAEVLRELTLEAAPGPGRACHLSAASGLVRTRDRLYVVADDEHRLGVFPATGDEPGELLTLFPGDLPHDRAERKVAKPDLESLARLPAFPGFSRGALLALGSGATPNRETGVLVGLDADDFAREPAIPVALTALYRGLRARLAGTPNIEGAFVSDRHLCLLHRGHKRQSANACIRLELRQVLEALAADRSIGDDEACLIQRIDLGTVDGVPLCFTDGAALPGGHFAFAAVAENTENSFDDGPCVGAAVGVAGPNGQVAVLERLDRRFKVEGIEAQPEAGIIRLLLVTDADDPAVPAMLLRSSLPASALSRG